MLQPLCERCGNHPARVSVTRMFLGGERETEFLCENCSHLGYVTITDTMPDFHIVSELTRDGRLDRLDEHIADAPFEALMEACFASDEGFMDDDIFGADWQEESFGDDEKLNNLLPDDDNDPFADEDEEGEETSDAQINLFQSIEAIGEESEAVCPGCGTTWEQIALDERAGCPKCYATFRASLTALLEQVQREALHIGKTPRAAQKRRLRLEHLRQRRDNQLQLLRNRLAEAVKSERYEEAATLRDKIKIVSSSLF